jgi:hypothetical protein
VGALAAAISEETDAIEDIYEPYLLQIGSSTARRAGASPPARLRALRARLPEGGPGQNQKKLF